MSRAVTLNSPDRISTGVAGLDKVLFGGLSPGSVFIVQGPPGAGKTILANQLCFRQAAAGRHSLYITLLAESHDRLLQHLGSMDFYDESRVPDSVYYISAFDTLTTEGLPGILRLLRSESEAHQASLLILDGLFVVEEALQSDREFRKFINDLEILAHLMGSTVLLLTNNSSQGNIRPEYTMVDGWIELNTELREYRAFRHLMVHKYRGSDFLSGRHALTISNDGITVLPRLETIAHEQPAAAAPGRLTTGCEGLDRMLHGGVPRHSTTLVQGPTGVGKTIAGLHFVSHSTVDERGLFFGFYETPDRLLRKASELGMPLEELVQSGALEIVWHPPTENLLDQLAHQLLSAVHQRGVKRLVIDGLDAFSQTPIYPQRLGPFLAALTNELEHTGTTAMFTSEAAELAGGASTLPMQSISAVAQNIILLRYRELQSLLERTLTVLKVRDSGFDPHVREFEITGSGIVLADQTRPRVPRSDD